MRSPFALCSTPCGDDERIRNLELAEDYGLTTGAQLLAETMSGSGDHRQAGSPGKLCAQLLAETMSGSARVTLIFSKRFNSAQLLAETMSGSADTDNTAKLASSSCSTPCGDDERISVSEQSARLDMMCAQLLAETMSGSDHNRRGLFFMPYSAQLLAETMSGSAFSASANGTRNTGAQLLAETMSGSGQKFQVSGAGLGKCSTPCGDDERISYPQTLSD